MDGCYLYILRCADGSYYNRPDPAAASTNV